MEEMTRAVILALIQGVTEFLPVSSSAHLILPAELLGWPDQGLAFDVAVHVGTLLAVLTYFSRDLRNMADGSLRALAGGKMNEHAMLVFYLGAATIPAGVAGLLLEDFVEARLRNLIAIAVSTVFFGLLLGWADLLGGGRGGGLNLRTAIVVGLAQAAAVIPGASRSGITMTAALFCGLDRESAARFSFLLSIPLIFAAGLLQLLQLTRSAETVHWGVLSVAMCVSAATALLTMHWFLRLLGRLGLMPFVLYRIVLGGVLFLIWA